MKKTLFTLGAIVATATAFAPPMPAATPPLQPPLAAVATPQETTSVTMTSLAKKARAAVKKLKSSKSVSKRFKVTATGKLLRHRAFKSHILTKKHPLRKQRMRRISQVGDDQLKTMQKLMLVTPKKR